MTEDFPTRYDFEALDTAAIQRWIDEDAFRAGPDERDDTYVIMMPLPNVTGALHMGHAMDNVMQDFLIRWHRMQGDNTLWQPGTDHAGIATQAVVEKRLFELEGKTRHDIGREALVERIFEWKDQYQARIISQQQRMGCSCDWHRQRFTMDPVCSAAVRETFFRLFSDGLVFRGNRLVNWDCHLQTAVSDDEIVTQDVQGHFWYIRYPVIDPRDGEPEYVVVATTRPETMLGDTAVACHPDPEGEIERLLAAAEERLARAPRKEVPEIQAEIDRLQARQADVLPLLVTLRDMAAQGRRVMLPLQEREIPLIVDEWAKPHLGTGSVKITPAHDPNDYDVWQRHLEEIGAVNILEANGTLNANAGRYAGQDRFEARDNCLADLTARGLIDRIEDRVIPIGHSDRSKTPIEPYLSRQWFIRMRDVDGGLVMGRGTANEFTAPGLAQAAIDAVEGNLPPTDRTDRRLTFYPDSDRYAFTYLSWLVEKRDWCISRQLWWGHRIPIWSGSLEGEQLTRFIDAHVEDHGHGTDYWLWFVDDDEQYYALPQLQIAAQGDVGRFEVLVCLRNADAEQRLAAEVEAWGLTRDADVLDTWFSSALWPFSTQGWPDPAGAGIEDGQTPLGADGDQLSALDYYYPGSCLVTGRDIITLWVARMIMMGLYNLGDVPFTDSFIHANILDGKGERMSKSKGNGIDPVDIMNRYGADAMRYVLCEMQSGTQDIRLPVQAISPNTGNLVDLAKAKHGRSIFTFLDPENGDEFDVLGTIPELPKATLVSDRFDVGAAFCTKLWNAARFAFLSVGEHDFQPVDLDDLKPEDRWILSRLSRTVGVLDGHLRIYNPSAGIGTVRDFFWSDFCDWYIEMVKPRLKTDDAAARSVMALVLDQVLRLLHPFVPFITEALWERLNAQVPQRGLESPLMAADLLMHARWPQQRADWEDDVIEAEFDLLRSVIRTVRDVRARYNVSPRKPLPLAIRAEGAEADTLLRLSPHLVSQAAAEILSIGPDPDRGDLAASGVVGDLEVYVAGVLDPVKERKRLETQKAKVLRHVEQCEGKLGNPGFTGKAPEAVIAKVRGQLAEGQTQLASIEKMLADLP